VSEALEDQLVRALRAGHRVLVLRGDDEAAMMELCEAVADRLDFEMRSYSRSEGIDGSGGIPSAQFLRDGLYANPEETLWVARDLLRDPDGYLRRALREHALAPKGAPLICLESQPHPLSLAPEFWQASFSAPTLDELETRVDAWARARARTHEHPALESLATGARELARDGLGLSWREFRLSLAEALDDPSAEFASCRRALLQSKARHLAAQGMVEAVRAAPGDQLGGLDAFKDWLDTRARAFEPAARCAAIPQPRGVLLIGVQGCGKSLAARVCAHRFGLPLYRLDPGRIFEGVVGASESRLDALLALLERMSPLVLWLDEVDKSLAGAEASSSDGGTTARVIGRLLTWLQEHEYPVFVVATANHPQRLPPEMLRRGRFDELFFVDLPNADARAAILDIHLRSKPAAELGQAPPLADQPEAYLAQARAAEGFSGAELEAALVEARLAAYARGEALSAEDLEAALGVTVPLSQSRREDIAALRAWAQARTRRA
jgi:hypothetical protein